MKGVSQGNVQSKRYGGSAILRDALNLLIFVFTPFYRLL